MKFVNVRKTNLLLVIFVRLLLDSCSLLTFIAQLAALIHFHFHDYGAICAAICSIWTIFLWGLSFYSIACLLAITEKELTNNWPMFVSNSVCVIVYCIVHIPRTISTIGLLDREINIINYDLDL